MTSMHYTTHVLLLDGLDYPVPMLILGASDAADIAAIPLPTSLHRRGNEVVGMSHAEPSSGPIPVSDAWISAVEHGYDNRVKVVVVLEPVERDIATSWADTRVGVDGDDLPPWLLPLLQQRIHAATRDVQVSAGNSVLDVMVDPSAPTVLPDWADRIIPPGGGGAG